MYYLSEAQKLLGGGQIVGAKKDQLLTICPRCRAKKFYFGLTSGRSQCKKVDCGVKFHTIYSLESFCRKMAYNPAVTFVAKSNWDFDPWAGETEDAVPVHEHERAAAYLASRGCSVMKGVRPDDVWAMKKSGTLIFPVDNILTGEQTPYFRRLSGSLRWVGGAGFQRVHHLYNAHKIKEAGNKTVVVVEGIMDVITPLLYNCAIATLGAEYSNFLMAWLEVNCKAVWHIPDNDEAGRASAKKLKKLCKVYGLQYKNVAEEFKLFRDNGCKDIAEAWQKDSVVRIRIQWLNSTVRERNENDKRKSSSISSGRFTSPR